LNLTTWLPGLPTSSSHRLIGGVIASVASVGFSVLEPHGLYKKVLLPSLVSPTFGFWVAAAALVLISWVFRNRRYGPPHGARVAVSSRRADAAEPAEC
jgi:inorganic phosphate transporter, PiT family